MKYLITGFLSLAVICFHSNGFAQKSVSKDTDHGGHEKPALFYDLPDQLPLQPAVMQSLLNTTTGQKVQITMSDKFTYEGVVSSVTAKYNNTIHSVFIRSTNRPGAGFNLSQVTLPDGSVMYSGRIISFQSSDCFELKKIDDQYYLVKRNFNDLVND